ncbi:hypothetical protein pb186bvf_007394 [Paramecium bursaria]
MNKYTLEFLNSEIEYEYQAQKNIITRLPVLKATTVGFIIEVIIKMVQINSLENRLDILGLVTVIYLFLQLIYAHYNNEKTRMFLLITNIIGMLQQINLHKDGQQIYLLGQNMMIIHCLIFYEVDFREGIVQVIFSLIVRLTIGSFMSSMEAYTYILSVGATSYLLIHIYKRNHQLRLLYLQNIRDSNWERLLPDLIELPFVYVSYQQHTMSFRTRVTNMSKQTVDELIHKTYVQGQVLQNYLYYRNDIDNKNILVMESRAKKENWNNLVNANGRKKKKRIICENCHEQAKDFTRTIRETQKVLQFGMKNKLYGLLAKLNCTLQLVLTHQKLAPLINKKININQLINKLFDIWKLHPDLEQNWDQIYIKIDLIKFTSFLFEMGIRIYAQNYWDIIWTLTTFDKQILIYNYKDFKVWE